jgi:hypothetical protein
LASGFFPGLAEFFLAGFGGGAFLRFLFFRQPATFFFFGFF